MTRFASVLLLSGLSMHALAESAVPARAPDPAAAASIEAVTLHPLFAASYVCSEHFEGQVPYLGDALGSDCMVMGGVDGDEGFMKAYRGKGERNRDWYGWGEPVLSPIDGTVERVHVNPETNEPGRMGKPPASFILLARADGTKVMVAHIAEPSVSEGDRVQAGQALAVVGNNGFSRAPHIHVGAWRDKTPLQIRFDLRALAALQRRD